MYFLLIIVLAALLAALFFRSVSRSRAKVLANLDQLPTLTQPVDVAALQNLLDPAQTQFLRARLSFWQFCRVHHERMMAAAEYVALISSNAAILLQLGQLGRANPNPEIAQAAQAIVERALVVRMIAMRTLIMLYLQSVTPGVAFGNDKVFEGYRKLTESTLLFTRLQRPAFAGRVSTML